MKSCVTIARTLNSSSSISSHEATSIHGERIPTNSISMVESVQFSDSNSPMVDLQELTELPYRHILLILSIFMREKKLGAAHRWGHIYCSSSVHKRSLFRENILLKVKNWTLVSVGVAKRVFLNFLHDMFTFNNFDTTQQKSLDF